MSLFETARNIFAVLGMLFTILAVVLFAQHIIVRHRRNRSRYAHERAWAKVAARPAGSSYVAHEGSLGAEAMIRPLQQ